MEYMFDTVNIKTIQELSEILQTSLGMPAIQKSVDDFTTDWEDLFGKISIADL